MSEELKPVNCGCGGEAFVNLFCNGNSFSVSCNHCEIETRCYHTESEAITAWNTAMSGNETGVRPPRMAEWLAQPLTK